MASEQSDHAPSLLLPPVTCHRRPLPLEKTKSSKENEQRLSFPLVRLCKEEDESRTLIWCLRATSAVHSAV
ncbi:hypothetical protein ACLOJK_008192 [Asimina triloba]